MADRSNRSPFPFTELCFVLLSFLLVPYGTRSFFLISSKIELVALVLGRAANFTGAARDGERDVSVLKTIEKVLLNRLDDPRVKFSV